MNVYDAIYQRRDVREFRPDAVSDSVLARILNAAHHAGSVGFMQPWNFIIVRSRRIREQVYDSFLAENRRAAEHYRGERRELYDALKLEGILESPLNLAVACDRRRGGPHVLGRNTIPDTDLYSTCCAIQNLWLAARAEGIGVGWVSILDPERVKAILNLPPEMLLVAYLCLGYPVRFEERPLLESVGWEQRRPLAEVVFEDAWDRPWQVPAGE